jgi:hypothetical protein
VSLSQATATERSGCKLNTAILIRVTGQINAWKLSGLTRCFETACTPHQVLETLMAVAMKIAVFWNVTACAIIFNDV